MVKPTAPPTEPADAIEWVKDAAAHGRHILDEHFYKRCRQRRISPLAWRRVLQTVKSCTAYVPENGPLAGGTSWRIVGLDFEDEETALGVETYLDHLVAALCSLPYFESCLTSRSAS